MMPNQKPIIAIGCSPNGTIKHYLSLIKKKKEIQKKIDLVEGQIASVLKVNGGRIEKFGHVIRSVRHKKYNYSQEIKSIEQYLDYKKMAEEASLEYSSSSFVGVAVNKLLWKRRARNGSKVQ